MKKFIVIETRKSLFKAGKLFVDEHPYDHAVDAWRCLKALREHNARDNRWPVLKVEVILR